MSQPSQEVLFYARCQLEGMLVENQDLQRRGESPAYTENAFYALAEQTREAFRKAMGYDTNP